MATTDVRYVIEVDDQGGIRKLQTFDQALADLQKTSGSAGTAVRSFGSDFLTRLVPAFTAGQLAADAVKKTFGFLKDQFVDTMGAAIDAERVDRALESSLSIIGQTAGGTADMIKRYASELQRKTIYDDETIKSAQALIIQLRGTTNQLDLVTEGAIGLASVFGMDLQTAARNVALGFEGNYIQLSRMIPAVRNATTEGEKHAAMIEFLAGAYKRAKTEIEPFGGQLSLLKKTYNEIQETLGSFVTKNETVLNSLAGLKEIITWLTRESGKFAGTKSFLDRLIENTPALMAIMDSLKLASLAAKIENDNYARSWEGVAEAVMNARRFAIDPLPIIIHEKITLPLTESQKALQEEMRWLRMLGSFDATAGIKENSATIYESFGGIYAMMEKERGPGEDIFSGLIKSEGKVENSTEGMADVWGTAMGTMLANAVTFGDGMGTIWKNLGNIFGGFVKDTVAGFELMVLKEMWAAERTVMAEKIKAAARAVAKVFEDIPFPFDIVAAIAAFAAVNALFSKLFSTGIKMKELESAKPAQYGFSGVVTRPTLFLTGEAGAEDVQIRPRSGGSRGGGSMTGSMTLNFGPFYCIDGGEMARTVRFEILPIIQEAIDHGDLRT